MSFGEMWIDRAEGFDERYARVPEDLKANLDEFIEKGYTIFKGVISPEQADRIQADVNGIFDSPSKYIYSHNQNFGAPEGLDAFPRGSRVQDVFALSEPARDAIGAPAIKRFVEMLFEEDVIAMQSLSFQYGSEQAMHQDTAYVVSQKPLHLVASWIALEDIQPGSGELIYYPGSHKFDHFLFGNGRKHWHQAQDGHDVHREFLDSLHEKAKAQGIERDSFIAKKGDVLLWHADLAHGGSPITQPDQTRRSLVAHYCPKSVGPNYKAFNRWFYHEHKHKSGMYFSSTYYDLKPLDRGLNPIIKFDGNQTHAGRARRLMSRVENKLRRMVGV